MEEVVHDGRRGGAEKKQKMFLNEDVSVIRDHCLEHGYGLTLPAFRLGKHSTLFKAEVLETKVAENSVMHLNAGMKEKRMMVAVKVINVCHEEDYVTRALPRQISGQFKCYRHSNVLEIFDVFKCQEYIYVVMELAKTTLIGYLKHRIEPLSELEAKVLFIQIILGVKEMHDRCVFHCSLSAENILILDSGEVKISGFGHHCSAEDTNKPTLPPRIILPPFLEEDNDRNMIDIWQLGIILRVLLSSDGKQEKRPAIDLGEDNEMHGLSPTLSQGCKSLLQTFYDMDKDTKLTVDDLLEDSWLKEPLTKIWLKFHASKNDKLMRKILRLRLKELSQDNQDDAIELKKMEELRASVIKSRLGFLQNTDLVKTLIVDAITSRQNFAIETVLLRTELDCQDPASSSFTKYSEPTLQQTNPRLLSPSTLSVPYLPSSTERMNASLRVLYDTKASAATIEDEASFPIVLTAPSACIGVDDVVANKTYAEYEERLGIGSSSGDRQPVSLRMLAIENEKAEALKAAMCVRNTYRRVLPELNVEEEKEKERKRLAEIRRRERKLLKSEKRKNTMKKTENTFRDIFEKTDDVTCDDASDATNLKTNLSSNDSNRGAVTPPVIDVKPYGEFLDARYLYRLASAKVSVAQNECKNVQQEMESVMGQMEVMKQAGTKPPMCETRKESRKIYTKDVNGRDSKTS